MLFFRAVLFVPTFRGGGVCGQVTLWVGESSSCTCKFHVGTEHSGHKKVEIMSWGLTILQVQEATGFNPLPKEAALAALYFIVCILAFYMFHCVFVSAEMYSAPSIVLQSRGGDGSVHVFDDFREAYAWLRFNTKPDAKVDLPHLSTVLSPSLYHLIL